MFILFYFIFQKRDYDYDYYYYCDYYCIVVIITIIIIVIEKSLDENTDRVNKSMLSTPTPIANSIHTFSL